MASRCCVCGDDLASRRRGAIACSDRCRLELHLWRKRHGYGKHVVPPQPIKPLRALQVAPDHDLVSSFPAGEAVSEQILLQLRRQTELLEQIVALLSAPRVSVPITPTLTANNKPLSPPASVDDDLAIEIVEKSHDEGAGRQATMNFINSMKALLEMT